jgi:8-oxo-dGTP diphosphatase
MEIIKIGEKDKSKKYDFRETCFGIYVKNNEILVTIDPKRNQYTFIGGGIESGESHEETLKREFLEEVGIKIKDIKEFITIDCFWLAGGDYPMESLANFYKIDIDEYLENVETEGVYKFVNMNELTLPLPYQEKALELIKKEVNN